MKVYGEQEIKRMKEFLILKTQEQFYTLIFSDIVPVFASLVNLKKPLAK